MAHLKILNSFNNDTDNIDVINELINENKTNILDNTNKLDGIRELHKYYEKYKRYHNYDKSYINDLCKNNKIQQTINDFKNELNNIHKLNMHTYRNETPIYDEFYTHITDKSPEKEYSDNYKNKSCIHIGQLKLLHHEIKLIEQTLYELWGTGRLSMNDNKYAECDRPIVVIAPGGAAGHHFMQSTVLLPDIKFELYDPHPFEEQLINYPNVSTFTGYFTDETATMLRDKYSKDHVIIIVSDIRTADYKTSTKDRVEEDIHSDMKMQDKWFRIINPDFCIYKFRTEYDYKQKIKPYNGLKGELYFQITPPPILRNLDY